MKAKRIISILLTLALLLSMVPGTFAAERVVIEAVQVTVSGIAVGSTTNSITVTLPDDANYTVRSQSIVKHTGSSTEPFSGTFGSNIYTLDLVLVPKDGFVFLDNDVEGEVLGENITRYDYPLINPDEMWISVVYVFATPIDKLDLTVTGLEKGKPTSGVQVTTPTDANYSLEYLEFLDGDEYPFEGDFDSDIYNVLMTIVPADGYCLTNDTIATVNGEDVYTWVSSFSSYAEVEYSLDLRTPIEAVDITLTGFEQGRSAADVTVTLPADANYTLDEFYIVDINWDSFSGTFENGKYAAVFNLSPADGFYFPQSAKVTLNGEVIDLYIPYSGSYLYLERSLDLRAPIDKVELTVTGMEKGRSAADVEVILPETVNYAIDSFRVTDANWNEYTGTFEGGLYITDIYLVSADGFYFAEDAEITLNGAVINSYYSINDNRTVLNVEHRLETRTPIEAVALTVTGMEQGKTAGGVQVTVPETANYAIDNFQVTDTNWDEYTGTFEGGLYITDIYLVPADGFYFSDDAKVTVNGQAPDYLNIQNDRLNAEYHLDLRTPITQIDLPAWPAAPKAGDTVPTPTLTAPEGKDYILYTGLWLTLDESLAPGSQFANNTSYYCASLATPASGCKFTDDTIVTVDGEAYTGLVINTGSQLLILKTYSIGSAKLIDQFKLSGTTPTAGKEPGEITSTGTGYTLEQTFWGVADNGSGTNISALTGPFQAGDYAYLALVIKPAAGYTLDMNGQVLLNGKAYSISPEFTYIDSDGGAITVVVCLGKVTDGSALRGDFTGDGKVTDADVIYLLWYTVFPEDYPIEGDADFTGDNKVTDADVIYLLWYTVFPEDYPID